MFAHGLGGCEATFLVRSGTGGSAASVQLDRRERIKTKSDQSTVKRHCRLHRCSVGDWRMAVDLFLRWRFPGKDTAKIGSTT